MSTVNTLEQINEETNPNATANYSAEEYLAFISDGLHFVVSASNITEIIMYHGVTHLPKVPDFIKGIINLRGQIIPIIDVRLRMNRPAIEYNEEACIIVIGVNSVLIGLLVEKVSHVVSISADHISPAPSKTRQELVGSIAHIENIDYLMLDCEQLVTQEL